MLCKDVRKKLTILLDGECSCCEVEKIEIHLEGCPRCRMELEELKKLQHRLDQLKPVQAPSDLHSGIMMEIAGLAAAQKSESNHPQRIPGSRHARKSFISLARDLVAAAAVATAIAWLGAGWWAPAASAVDNRISSAVLNYTRYSELALFRAYDAITDINGNIRSTTEKITLPYVREKEVVQ